MEDEEDAGKLDTAPEKDVNAEPGSFEADPMEFILKKYVTLNSLLEELMTPSFRDYVDAIFIVAPKPTTFKILLHNGQYFFLTFLGKAYEATINGRNYYLVQIGEKERCMIAISKLLRFGSPLKTKGPEGSEQGTRDEMDAEADAGEETAEETPAEPESLEESIKILTNMLLLEATNKYITSTDPFLNLMVAAISGSSAASGGKHYVGKKDSGGGNASDGESKYHVRGNFGQQDETEQVIHDAMKFMNFKPNQYTVKYIDPKDDDAFDLGARSSKFITYEVVAKSVTKSGKYQTPPEIKVGDEVYLISNVNKAKPGQAAPTIVGKALTPKGLGVQGDYTTADSAIKKVDDAIKSHEPATYPLLHNLLQDVIAGKKIVADSLADTKTVDVDVTLSKESIAELQKVAPADINTIGKDFGEILGGIYLSLSVGITSKLSWPSGNYELIDFFLNGYGISSKYKKGAAASITGLIEDYKVYVKEKTISPEEKDFLDTISVFTNPDFTGPDAFLELAKKEIANMPAINTLASILKIPVEQVNRKTINDNIVNLVSKYDTKEKKTEAFKKRFNPLFKEIGHAPSGYGETNTSKDGKIDWSEFSSKNYYGLITSGFSYYICDRLNKVPIYLETLKAVVATTGVKQMYLDVFIKQSKMTFSIKSFNDPDAKFKFHIPSIAATNPTSSKLGFKLQ